MPTHQNQKMPQHDSCDQEKSLLQQPIRITKSSDITVVNKKKPIRIRIPYDIIVVIKSLLCQTSEAEKSFNIIVAIKKQPVMPTHQNQKVL
jgi:hypothetical protein